MVREVQLSWDCEAPYPAELQRSDWETEDSILSDLPEKTRKNKRRKRPGNVTSPNVDFEKR